MVFLSDKATFSAIHKRSVDCFFDDAKVCELVHTFLLDKISEKYNKRSISLHRENKSSVFKNISNTQLKRTKKSFKKHSRNLI